MVSNVIADANNMDKTLAYMYKVIEEYVWIIITKKDLFYMVVLGEENG